MPGTHAGHEPILSPDGATVAFVRERSRYRAAGNGGEKLVYESAATWTVGIDGSEPRRLTPWRNRVGNTPSSFTPDGRTLLVSRRVGYKRHETLGIDLASGRGAVLLRNGFGATYSPDGTQLAFLRGRMRTFESHDGTIVALMSDLYVRPAADVHLRRLSKTPSVIETAPSWDPSGRRLAYTRVDILAESGILGFGDSVVEINPDGSCRTTIARDPDTVLFGSAWQPGPGREAGPIAC